MLLLPFVENSFKHGNLVNGILDINIKLVASLETITFQVENTCTETLSSNSGIGLENIKKRLELLYPNTYELQISKDSEHFKIHLKLNTLQNDN
jgi:LytS/YehU family sensor histidine kinase